MRNSDLRSSGNDEVIKNNLIAQLPNFLFIELFKEAKVAKTGS